MTLCSIHGAAINQEDAPEVKEKGNVNCSVTVLMCIEFYMHQDASELIIS